MNDGEIVERLRRHYKENVLEPEPDPKHQEVEERLWQNGMLDKRLLAEGLSGYVSSYVGSKRKISERELDGAETIVTDMTGFSESWGFEAPRFISMKVPEDEWDALAEKWNLQKDSGGIALRKNRFEKGSVFDGICVAILTYDSLAEHEILHLLHSSRSGALKELDEKREAGKTTYELALLGAEFGLISELFAYRSELKNGEIGDYKELSSLLKSLYAEKFSEFVCKFDESGSISEEKVRSYLERKAEDGTRALEVLEKNCPGGVVSRIMISIGQTEGEYAGPIDELVEWSKRYKEVLKSE